MRSIPISWPGVEDPGEASAHPILPSALICVICGSFFLRLHPWLIKRRGREKKKGAANRSRNIRKYTVLAIEPVKPVYTTP